MKMQISNFRENDVVNDPDVKKTVVEQTKQWSEMMASHRSEEWKLRRYAAILKYIRNNYRKKHFYTFVHVLPPS